MKVLKYKGLEVDPRNLNETVQVRNTSSAPISLQESAGGESFIMPRIESIHAGKTKNNVYYPAGMLKGDKDLGSGVYSWTKPYPKPVIYNHDLETEVTGRVERAAYSDFTQAGKPGIILVPKITEPNAVQAIRDGRLLTVSIGAQTDSMTCSICGTDIANEGYCGHMKGEVYDGEEAHWIAGNIFFHELSWVNQPADENAFIIDTGEGNVIEATKESLHKENKFHEYYGVPKTVSLTESVAVDNKVKEEYELVSKENKALAEAKKELEKAQEKAIKITEAIEVEVSDVNVKQGESATLEFTGDEFPEDAEVTINDESFSVTKEEEEYLISASEDAEVDAHELTLTITYTENEESESTEVSLFVEVEEGEKELEPEEKSPKNKEDELEEAFKVTEDGILLNGTLNVTKEALSEESWNNLKEEVFKEELSDVLEQVSNATKTISELNEKNKNLNKEISTLTSELKEKYIDEIKDKYDGDLSEDYISRLDKRSIASLKETLEDIESGFLKVKKKKQDRKVKKVENPIKEKKESKKEDIELTEAQQIDILSNLLRR